MVYYDYDKFEKVFIKSAKIFILPALLLLVWSCDQITDPDVDDDTESLNDFRFYYPIEEYGDELLRTPFISDEGELDIGIVY